MDGRRRARRVATIGTRYDEDGGSFEDLDGGGGGSEEVDGGRSEEVDGVVEVIGVAGFGGTAGAFFFAGAVLR